MTLKRQEDNRQERKKTFTEAEWEQTMTGKIKRRQRTGTEERIFNLRLDGSERGTKEKTCMRVDDETTSAKKNEKEKNEKMSQRKE